MQPSRSTVWWIRHVLAILALPVVVAVAIPMWLLGGGAFVWSPPRTPWDWVAVLSGVSAMAAGLTLAIACIRRFGGEGGGTLAPWDPPRRLVVAGAYAHVRNPMITGVVLILAGEMGILRSGALGRWTLLFALANLLYLPLLEEPMLRARFGEPYDVYRRHVPRFIPRLRPWRPRSEGPTGDAGAGP